MTLAQHLHEMTYRQPISEARTALLFASHPHYTDGDCRRYVEAMARSELEEAFVILAGSIARYGMPKKLDGQYPPNGSDL